MIGIPYRFVRESDEDGKVDKTVFLTTRRSGEAGESMKAAARLYRKHQKQMGKVYQKHETVDRRVKELKPDDPKLDDMIAAREGLFDELMCAEEAAGETAENLVRLSLTENYGAEAAAGVMDQLTDTDLHNMVVTIQTGEQPEDFFPSSGSREKSTTTSPSEGSLQESSSSTDSLQGKSNAEK